MLRALSLLIAIATLSLCFSGDADAAEASAESRMRDALRNTLLQLRTAENERAILQAAQAQSDNEKKMLTAQVAALSKQCKSDKETADKTIAGLNSRAAEQGAEITRLTENLAKCAEALKQATSTARAKENERAKLAADIIGLNRTVADQKTKNGELFKLGKEILLRYERFGLGDAIGAKEPFVGITRVKLENFVQDYQDKLADQKIETAR